jgi:hypothetical protein
MLTPDGRSISLPVYSPDLSVLRRISYTRLLPVILLTGKIRNDPVLLHPPVCMIRSFFQWVKCFYAGKGNKIKTLWGPVSLARNSSNARSGISTTYRSGTGFKKNLEDAALES